MKINRSYLSRVMQLASRFAPAGKNVHPALAYVRMQVFENGAMSICATNAKDSVFAWLPVIDPKPFTALVPAQMLSNALTRLEDEEITFKLVKERFIITRKSGTISMMTMDLGYFPPLPPIDDAGNWIRIETQDIHDMTKSLLCGTSEEAKTERAYQNVARIRSAGPEFLAVASDGNRLALVDGKCSSEAGIELLIPLSALRALDSALSTLQAASSVQIGEDKKRIWVKINEYLQFCFTKLNVKYPDIDRVIASTKFDLLAITKTEDLRSVFELARVVGDVPVRLEIREKVGLIAAAKKDAGDLEQEFPITKTEPFELVTGYSSDYIMPILRRIESEYAELAFCHKEAAGALPETYTLRLTQETDRLRSSWIVQSLNRYPGATDVTN